MKTRIFQNYKQEILTFAFTVLSLIISIIAISFAWYYSNGGIYSAPTIMPSATVPGETLEINEIPSGEAEHYIEISEVKGLTLTAPQIAKTDSTITDSLGTERTISSISSFSWFKRTPLGFVEYVPLASETAENTAYGANFVQNSDYNLKIILENQPQTANEYNRYITLGVEVNGINTPEDQALANVLAYAVVIEKESGNELLFNSAFHYSNGTLATEKISGIAYFEETAIRVYIWADALAIDQTNTAELVENGSVNLQMEFDFSNV